MSKPVVPGGEAFTQSLTDQLTLSQLGGQIMHTKLLHAPLRIFRPSFGPEEHVN